jgi:hypothetical protein
VKLSGSFSLSSEQYSTNGIRARRPNGTSRAILQPTITLFDQIVLPFEVYLSSGERGFRQPFNQFGVSPRLFGWLTLHAGYYSARLSELTFGDTRLLGGGIEMSPGAFRFSALYGRSQQALAPDTSGGFLGAYKRTMWAVRLGVGNESAGHIGINLLRAFDDSSSIMSAPRGLAPTENAVFSLGFGFPVFDNGAHFSTEAAVSAFSNDTRSKEVGNLAGRLGWLFTPRTSSQVDGAIRAALRMTFSPAVGVSINGRWVGPGFVTLGYAQLQNDLLDVTVAPTLRLFDKAFHVRGSVGLRFNNLRQNRLATTRRTIGSATAAVQVSKELSFDLGYTNYGMRSTPRNDTLRIDNITQSITFSPRYTFEWFGGTNTTSASYSFQNFTDHNIISGARNKRRSHAASAMWTLGLPSTLSFATRVAYTQARSLLTSMRIISFGETIGHQFLERRLSLSGTFGYNIMKTVAASGQLQAGLQAGYSLDRWGRFSLSLSLSQVDDGDPLVDASYREMIGRLQYSYSF